MKNMSNKTNDDVSILLEADQILEENWKEDVATAWKSIPPAKDVASAFANFMEQHFELSQFIAKYLVGLLKGLYEEIKLIETSEYSPVLSQKISDVLDRDVSIKVFSKQQYLIVCSGQDAFLSSFAVKTFTPRQIAALIIMNQASARVGSKIKKFETFAMQLIVLHLLKILIEYIEKRLGYIPSKSTLKDKFLFGLFKVLNAEFINLILAFSTATIYRKITEDVAAKEIKKQGLVNEYVSAFKKYQSLGLDVKLTGVGKALLKLESWFKSEPKQKEILKKVLDDPEKVELILKVAEKVR